MESIIKFGYEKKRDKKPLFLVLGLDSVQKLQYRVDQNIKTSRLVEIKKSHQ